jgi:CheY-like chemotaxis protein
MRGQTHADFRVLIVDDNIDTATSLTMIIESWGFAAVVAHDGAAGLRLAREFQPHAVLLDIGLPVLDGFEVARQLRSLDEFAQTLIVASSGYNQEKDLERATAVGIDHYLIKPFDPAKLEQLLMACRSAAEPLLA